MQSEDMVGTPTTPKRPRKRADKRRRERRVSTELPQPLLRKFKARCATDGRSQAEALCAAVESYLRPTDSERVMTTVDVRQDAATRRAILRAALYKLQTCEWRLAPLPEVAPLSEHLKVVHIEELLSAIHRDLSEIVRQVAAMADLVATPKSRRSAKPTGDVSPFKPEEEQRHAS
jgi:hypothetical protein